MKRKKVVCFGEVLWDVLPEGRKPGGAPMNVAYHLNKLGIQGDIISRVGQDAKGVDLLQCLKKMGIATGYIQQDPMQQTSEVMATMDEQQEVKYEIVQPVAWDFIRPEDRLSKLVEEADVLVFGSLVARNAATRATLFGLLEKAAFRLFDINLRAPHYTRETLEYLLRKADAVKLNYQELGMIATWHKLDLQEETLVIAHLMDSYRIAEVIVTRGGDGASYYTAESRYDYRAYPVTVQDTIGSGDSFLAAFLAQKLLGKSIEDTLDYAVALGAYVTSHAGANPEYRMADLHRFMWQKQLEQAKWK